MKILLERIDQSSEVKKKTTVEKSQKNKKFHESIHIVCCLYLMANNFWDKY